MSKCRFLCIALATLIPGESPISLNPDTAQQGASGILIQHCVIWFFQAYDELVVKYFDYDLTDMLNVFIKWYQKTTSWIEKPFHHTDLQGRQKVWKQR
jgi:hypothetical protein